MRIDPASARSAAIRAYFDLAYGLLVSSPEGRRFLDRAAPLPGVVTHGYTTPDDIDALIGALGLDASSTILDLGCGVGGVAREVARRTSASIVGIDGSARAIQVATTAALAEASSATFRVGEIRRPPEIGASGAYALDSLMFDGVTGDVLAGIAKTVRAPGRLFATYLSSGSAARDPVGVAATSIGLPVTSSTDVTDALIVRSLTRRSIARRMIRSGSPSLRGGLALLLVVVEESLVLREARAGRLRRWRTIVDLHAPG